MKNNKPKGFTQKQYCGIVDAASRLYYAVSYYIDPLRGAEDWSSIGKPKQDLIKNGVRLVIRAKDISLREYHELTNSLNKRSGWTYGDILDYEQKTCPSMVPFDKLDSASKYRIGVFLAIIKTLYQNELKRLAHD